jgi:fluoride ion exporter CrcB/FEX
MLNSVVAVSVGAATGALLRWEFGTRLNSLFPRIPARFGIINPDGRDDGKRP